MARTTPAIVVLVLVAFWGALHCVKGEDFVKVKTSLMDLPSSVVVNSVPALSVDRIHEAACPPDGQDAIYGQKADPAVAEPETCSISALPGNVGAVNIAAAEDFYWWKASSQSWLSQLATQSLMALLGVVVTNKISAVGEAAFVLAGICTGAAAVSAENNSKSADKTKRPSLLKQLFLAAMFLLLLLELCRLTGGTVRFILAVTGRFRLVAYRLVNVQGGKLILVPLATLSLIPIRHEQSLARGRWVAIRIPGKIGRCCAGDPSTRLKLILFDKNINRTS